MQNEINIEKILFLDIETTSQTESLNELDSDYIQLWNNKVDSLKKSNKTTQTAEEYYRSAGIYAEFGKIICISVGYLNNSRLRLKSYFGNNEKNILEDFAALLSSHFNKADHYLCAHNGKEFDFPFIARRMVINGISLPESLNLYGKKPWEIKHLDTMELWKFGDYKSYTSLNLLAKVLGVPTPKDDIDGSMVYDVYWKEKNMERIVTYCKKDVTTIVRIYQRLMGIEYIENEKIEYA